MNQHSLKDSPKYRAWTLERDRALEALHITAQLQSTDQMRAMLTQVLVTAKANFFELKNNPGHHAVDSFEKQVLEVMRRGADNLFWIMTALRLRVFLLSKTAETEIIAQHFPEKKIQNRFGYTEKASVLAKDSRAGGGFYQRINLYLDRLGRKIVNQAHQSAITNESVDDFLVDVFRAFPKKNVYKRPPRVLKPATMTEATEPTQKPTRNVEAAIDLIDEDLWKDMVEFYKLEFVPEWRGPESILGGPEEYMIQNMTGDVWYAWEFERDLTNEFVRAVRDGENTAASEAGITDFVWIAVIDSATDSCCRWRDGLLISEIEKELDEHQDEDDECGLENDGLNPPLHFNCRCRLAPALENIPDRPNYDTKGFDEWLNS